MSEEPGEAATPPEPPPRRRDWRRAWLSPAGISGIAAVLALFIGVAAILVDLRNQAPAAQATAGPASPAEPALFVYGTSMPGMSRYDSVSRYVVRSSRDTVDGLLYDSGLGYPLARFGPGGQVPGFVLWLDPATAEAAMAELTRVEAGLFHPVTVRTAAGVTAQAYEWLGSTDDLPRLELWDGSTAQFGQAVPWRDLQQGDCFQPDTGEETVVTVWCEAPHPWEVSFAGSLPQTGAGVRETAEAACDQAHVDFVGRPRPESGLAVRIFHGSADQDGNVDVVCAVGEVGEPTKGSLGDSDR